MNHPVHSKHLHTYLRYYDDAFIIWNGTEKQLTDYLSFINNIDTHIKTTSSFGKTAIYLDVNIAIDTHNTISTQTNRKATATDDFSQKY